MNKNNPFIIFSVGVVIYSDSGGLLELILSSIINSIPNDEKTSSMSILHSFYSWGSIFVVAITTGLLYAFKKENYHYIIIIWLIIPLVDFILFIFVPLGEPLQEENRESFRSMKGKYFFVLFLVIIFFWCFF
jgi:hypothetical protein